MRIRNPRKGCVIEKLRLLSALTAVVAGKAPLARGYIRSLYRAKLLRLFCGGAFIFILAVELLKKALQFLVI